MEPLIHLLRDGGLRKHIVQSPIDELLGPLVLDAVKQSLPRSVKASWEQEFETRLANFKPRVNFGDFDDTTVQAFIDAVWPAVRSLLESAAAVPSQQLLASVRQQVIPVGYDDISPTVWPRVVSSHIDIPKPGMKWDGSAWVLCADDAVVATLDRLDGAMHFERGVGVGGGVKIASIDQGLRLGKIDLDWKQDSVTIAAGGNDLMTLRPDIAVTAGSIATSAVFMGDTMAMFPSPLENVFESKGAMSFRVTNSQSQVRSMLIASDGRIVVNPGRDDTGAPSDQAAFRVNGGLHADVTICDRLQAETVVCDRLIFGRPGAAGRDMLSLAGRHVRATVVPGIGTRIIAFANTFGNKAIAHVSFLGVGSANVSRVGERSIDVSYTTTHGGEVMLSVFPNFENV
jgi:hypothetical protein